MTKTKVEIVYAIFSMVLTLATVIACVGASQAAGARAAIYLLIGAIINAFLASQAEDKSYSLLTYAILVQAIGTVAILIIVLFF